MIRHRPRHLCAIVGALAVSLAVAACAHPVAGEPQAGPYNRPVAEELRDVPEADLREEFDASEQEINEYWTSERMREAEPRDPGGIGEGDAPKDDPVADSFILPPTSGDPGSVPPDANGSHAQGEVWERKGLAARTVGRLYMTVDGVEGYVCSAAVVNSSSRSIVLTAAHCLWDTYGESGWVDSAMFVPGDTNGNAPYGRWYADQAWMPPEFQEGAFSDESGTSGDGWTYDVAFMQMKPQGGERIQDALGAQGIAFGERTEGLMVIGYPSAPPFDGTTMRYCSSPGWEEGPNSQYEIPCVMTPGHSGSAWYTRFNPETAAGYAVGTSSRGNGTISLGTSFSQTAYELYLKADEEAQ